MTAGSADTFQLRRTARDKVFAVARVVLVAAWVAWAALAWWSAPRDVSVAQAEREIANGQVVGYVRADGWTTDRTWMRPSVPEESGDGPVVAWRTSTWRVHWTTVTPDSSGDRAAALTARMEAAGAHWNLPVVGTPGRASGILAVALMIIFLAVVVFGLAPARGTRWFWFWIGLIAGPLGVLPWLLAERPWSRRAAALPVAAALDAGQRGQLGRHGGFAGIVFAFVGGILFSLLALAFTALVGGW
jgi:hypothetical protein